MPTYVIGDVQGCLTELEELLTLFNFDPTQDFLWFCGDLVNRGPDSLGVLRFIKNQLGANANAILGNHDLHLLAVYYGAKKLKAKDTLKKVIKADDCAELCEWLRHRSLIHYETQSNNLIVHAGIPPQWNLPEALQYAEEVETILQSEQCTAFFMHMYGNEPASWDPTLTGWPRLRYITNALTRMRYCSPDGAQLHFDQKGPLGSQSKNLHPWFQLPRHLAADIDIIFGHWAALNGHTGVAHIKSIDTGCVWGNRLTALRLEDDIRFQVSARKRYVT